MNPTPQSKTLSLGEQMVDMKKQNTEFHLTALTRLARIHHQLEDLQEVILQIPCLPGKQKPSPSAPPLSIKKDTAQ